MGGSSSSPSPSPHRSPPRSRSESVDISQIHFLDQDGPVRRVVCLLQNLKNIDIIVNSTDRTLNLTYGGEISNIILKLAGSEIQNELKEKYPNGINPGQVGVSNGHDLPYNYVCHCSLQNIQKRISHHEIREIITEVLRTAVSICTQPKIAFPAIGTGGMNFPPRVLKTIYCTILEFMIENPNSVESAYVLIHPARQELIDYAKTIDPNVEEQRLTYPVHLPSSWLQADEICKIQLSQNDAEYSSTIAHFRDTIGRNVNIIKIERIENKRLYVAFERYKNLLPSNQHTPKRLWHGTSHDCIDGIIRYGFDWRLTERAVYGQGCYFAKEACYSDQGTYSKPNGNGEKCMFLAYVLVGNCIQGNTSFNEGNIPSNEQTTVNNLQNPTIFVTYDDDQVYPAFLVVYK